MAIIYRTPVLNALHIVKPVADTDPKFQLGFESANGTTLFATMPRYQDSRQTRAA